MGAIKYMINLDNRLQTIYDMVRNNSKIIDVGADHGYLISKLIIDKKCPIGKCIDISLKCLKKAEKLAKYYNLEDKIKFSLSDGLSDVDENEVDDIVCKPTAYFSWENGSNPITGAGKSVNVSNL